MIFFLSQLCWSFFFLASISSAQERVIFRFRFARSGNFSASIRKSGPDFHIAIKIAMKARKALPRQIQMFLFFVFICYIPLVTKGDSFQLQASLIPMYFRRVCVFSLSECLNFWNDTLISETRLSVFNQGV